MHPHRRRKKKPSYGIRTVEINRGKNGFGFTISGQAPCILSCIISGSPAEKAGLRPGDYLIAVNGRNVSKVLHDDVVELIGNSSGILKLQIAENYYSDSSEEECVSAFKLRPKCLHKLRHRQFRNSVSRAEKVVHDLQTGALFIDHAHEVPDPSKDVQVDNICPNAMYLEQTKNALLDLVMQQQMVNSDSNASIVNCCFQTDRSTSVPALSEVSSVKEKEVPLKKYFSNEISAADISNEIFHSIFTEQELDNILYSSTFSAENQGQNLVEQVVLKAVVGYLGTIEMPKEPQLPISRLQTIRNCIRRLRIEKKVHTLALMTVFPQSIVLTNMQGLILAEFYIEKIAFSGVYSDDEKFFGLVTTHGFCCEDVNECKHEQGDLMSSSCHVFMVDPRLAPHHHHVDKAKAFHLTCNVDPDTNKCKEFPESADVILKGVAGLYRSKCNSEASCNVDPHSAMSQQASNTSSNSSNSDSGIGFRDEGNSGGRVFIDDNNHQYNSANLAFEEPVYSVPENSYPSHCCLVSNSKNSLSSSEKEQKKCIELDFDRLTVRAMPDPVGFQQNFDSSDLAVDTIGVDEKRSVKENLNGKISCHSLAAEACFKKLDADDLKRVNYLDTQTRKLSPKVYDLMHPYRVSERCPSRKNVDPAEWLCFTHADEQPQLDVAGAMEMNEENAFNLLLQDECILDENSGAGGLEVKRKLSKSASMRRYLGHKRNLCGNSYEAGTVSDGELSSTRFSNNSLLSSDHISDSSLHGSCISERVVDVGRVGSWATDFNSLLEDPVGLQAFSEFLKMEFSQENIVFWIACEKYRQLSNQEEMVKAAREIYSKHLCAGACEPVNVDSHARRVAEEGLNFPTPSIFLPAQKQIFNLMKFDCYQRFLKSSIFKDSVICEMQGQPLPYEKCVFSDEDAQKQEQKMISEERKRRSLFPWNKLTKTKANRLKVSAVLTGNGHSVRDKFRKPKNKVQDFHICDTSSTQSDGASSRSSFTDSDPGNEIRSMQHLGRNSTMKPSEHEMSFLELNCERVYLFSVELPNKKVISVKAKGGKTCEDILKPVLLKYGYKMEHVALELASSQKPIILASPISFIDNKHIIVLSKDLKNECIKMSDLETLTNQIFEDLMKTQPAFVGDISSVSFQNCRRSDSSGEKP